MNLFEAAKNIGTGLGLVAFIVATVAYVYRSRLAQRKALIESAPAEERSRLLEVVLRDFSVVPVESLSKEQRYQLVIKLIDERRERFHIAALVAVGLAVLLTIVAFIPGERGNPTRQLGVRLHDSANGGAVIRRGIVTLEGGGAVMTKPIEADGQVQFSIPAGLLRNGVTVHPRVTGYRLVDPVSLTSLPAGGMLEVQLVPDSSHVEGVVLDDPVSRQGLAGATLEFDSGLAMVTTDERGHFSVDLPRPLGARVPLRLTHRGRVGFDDAVTIGDQPLTVYFAAVRSR
jgi:hypothetical protein